MEFVIILIGIVVYVLIAIGYSNVFKDIAEMKGHDGQAVFWWTFFLGIVGMLMAVALPDRGAHEQGNEASKIVPQSTSPNKTFDNEDLPDL